MGYETKSLDIQDLHQREGLLKVWTENMSDSRISDIADARLRWFYYENPLEPPRTILTTYGEPEEVVGCGSTLPSRIWAMGRMVLAGVQCDFAVMKRHRLGGAAMAIQRALIASSRTVGEAFMLAFPNEKSLPIFKRVGYRIVTQAHGWVKPLRSYTKLRDHVNIPLVAKAASIVLDAALGVADFFRSLPHAGRYRGELLDRADERFDALWERCRDQRAITGDKTAAFLNWRYADFKSIRHRFFVLTDKRTNQMAGFVVFAVEGGRVFIHNLFAADMTSTLDALLLKFAATMRKAGCISLFVSYAGQSSFSQRLERLLFRPSDHRERNLALFVDEAKDPARAAYLLDPANWLLFEGEMDI